MANPTQPNTPNGDATDKARQDASGAGQAAKEDLDKAKHRARADFDDLKHEARREFEHAREAAGQFAEGQKNYAADQIGTIASALDKVSGELGSTDQSWAGRYAGDIAGRLQGVAQHTRSSSMDDLVGDVENFGRQRPTAFLAGAALLGFAASRFLSASANRRSQTSTSRYYGASTDDAYGGDGQQRTGTTGPAGTYKPDGGKS